MITAKAKLMPKFNPIDFPRINFSLAPQFFAGSRARPAKKPAKAPSPGRAKGVAHSTGFGPMKQGPRWSRPNRLFFGPFFKLKTGGHRINCPQVSTLDTNQIGLIMLVPLLTVIGVAIYFFRFSSRRRAAAHPENAAGLSLARRASRGLFEQPNRWLAVRSQDLLAVQRLLGLIHPMPCSWEEGITEAREDKLFISRPISGWILVIGNGLPEPADDVDKCYHFLVELSRKLGHVQFFSFNRALNHHSWALIERGCVFRAYAWAGRTLWNQGPVTAAEKDVGMVCFDYAADPADYALQESWTLNPEKVSRLAGWWSLDPSNLADKVWQARQGIVGDLSHSRQS
jgi:hypothetical protein